MNPVSEREIRTSFVNCSKGEAQRLSVPRDLRERPWEDLDFLGWPDASNPARSYLAAEHEGRLVCVVLGHQTGRSGRLHRNLCSVCLTVHPGTGVSLMTARRAGPAGRQGNSVGLYMCTDLACSLYVRGKKTVDIVGGGRFHESLTEEEQIGRTRANLGGFLATVLDRG
jgi:hypothetical protein